MPNATRICRPTGTLSRLPMGACSERSRGDNIGSARGLQDASGNVTDTCELDAFGRTISTTGRTVNPYRYDAAWGYISDPSGFQQLGVRFYWPEVGRFLQQDPVTSGVNAYAYALNNPVRYADANGESPTVVTGIIGAVGGGVVGGLYSYATGGNWKQGAIRGAITGGVTGLTLGLAGPAVAGLVNGGALGGALAGAVGAAAGGAAGQGYDMLTGRQRCFSWPELGASAALGAALGAPTLRPSTAPMQPVASWAPRGVSPNLNPGRWAMTGGPGLRNWGSSGVPFLGYPISNAATGTLPGSSLSYPPGVWGVLGLLGQRIIR